MDNHYLYVVVRKDLTATQICVQSAHAAIEIARNSLIPPELEAPHLVLCYAENEVKLGKILKYLRESGIICEEFHESDLDDSLTAIATEPLTGDRRKVCRKLQLLKSSHMVGGNS